MADEYVLEHCRPNCPKAAKNWSVLVQRLEARLGRLQIAHELQKKFGQIQYHHLPKISVAGCANGCSRPQIKDLGIVGYVKPVWNNELCNGCRKCVAACLEGALVWNGKEILTDSSSCLKCGDCLRACSNRALSPGEIGWHLLEGGRVGRHPRFADLAGTAREDQEAEAWVISTIAKYFQESLPEERLSFFLERMYSPKSSGKQD